MAYRPEAVNIRGASAGLIVQSIIDNDESGFLAGAPLANETVQGFLQAGQYILAHENRRNAFINTLMNKIAFSVIATFSFYSEWERYTEKGILEDGETIEEIYVGLTKGESYQWTENINDTMKALYGKRKNDVATAYHSINFEKRYPKTITDKELRKAFRSESQMQSFIMELIDSMYKSYRYDNYLINKYMLYRLALGGFLANIPVAQLTADNASAAVVDIKSTIEDASFIRTTYNRSGVPIDMPKERAILIRTTKFAATIDVEVLSQAFNLAYADFRQRELTIDGFNESEVERLNGLLADDPSYEPFTADELTKINSIYAFIVDERFFMNYQFLFEMTNVYNAAEMYWNYFLHVWKIYSTSPFYDCITVSALTGAVTAVTVSPATASMFVGTDLQLTATVTFTGLADQKVTWSISGQKSDNTYIDVNGRVHIGADESASSITAKATSAFDNTVSGSCTITVVSS